MDFLLIPYQTARLIKGGKSAGGEQLMAKPILEHKTGILQQKAHKGYLSGMMVFEFFSTGMPAIAASL